MKNETRLIYICPLCDLGGYKTKDSLIDHLKLSHPDLNDNKIKAIIKNTRKVEVPGL